MGSNNTQPSKQQSLMDEKGSLIRSAGLQTGRLENRGVRVVEFGAQNVFRSPLKAPKQPVGMQTEQSCSVVVNLDS